MAFTLRNSSLLYKAISMAGQLFITFIEIILTAFAKEKAAVIDPSNFEWTKYIEQHTAIIAGELQNVMNDYAAIPNIGDIADEQQRLITGEQNWRTYILCLYGAPVIKNAACCPETSRIISHIPGMTTAFFSILEPHTKIMPHRGPYKGVLRYHLGLVVPQPAELCGLSVDGSTYHWQAGSSLIFDDTHIHSAWNNSSEIRVVLFVDFKRDYIFPINLLNNIMIKLIRVSPFIANTLKKIEAGK